MMYTIWDIKESYYGSKTISKNIYRYQADKQKEQSKLKRQKTRL